MMKATLHIKVSYLEMLSQARGEVVPPRDGLTVMRAHHPSVAFYRYLYDAVGREYHWLSRARLSDAELAALIQDRLDEIHVLYVDGSPAGFAELNRQVPDEIELVQFGLMGDFIGQGLGKYFLQWTIDTAWSYKPRRFWLHTCTLDHPRALPNYLKAGFQLYKEELIVKDIPW